MFTIAVRNLARHKVKTALSVTAIAVSVAMYIVVDGWIVGMMTDSTRNIVSYETGAAKLQKTAYVNDLDELPMYENFSGWEKYAATLDAAGYAAAPRFCFTGTLYTETGTAPVVFYGVDPEQDAKVMRVNTAVDAGRWVRPGEYAITLGNMTADKLGCGLPMRPTKDEFENFILPAVPEADRDFVRGLYTEPGPVKAQAFTPKEFVEEAVAGRVILKSDLTQTEKDRYWALLAAAGRMNARISATIDIKTASGSIRHVNQLIDVIVVGTINASDPKINNNTAFIPLDILADDYGMMTGGAVTELLIRAKNADDTRLPLASESPDAIKAALIAAPGGLPQDLDVFGWQTYVKDYIAASAGDNWSTRIISLILFIISFLVIANTMLLAILERTKEIGMMRAQGTSDGQMVFLMICESGLVGLIGSLIGTAIGIAINIPMVKYGLDMTAMTQSMNGDIGYRVNGIFRSAWNIPVIAGTGIAATIFAALAAWLPTRRALKMPITESLRFD